MHPHSNASARQWWEEQARDELWDDDERQLFHPSNQQPPRAFPQPLTLLLSRRMYAQLHAIANDLELDPEETALHLLREELWRRYHLAQHV